MRQLSAIMFTEMVGFTALMQSDESEARASVDRHREIVRTALGAHDGEPVPRIEELEVTARTSAFAFKRRNEDVREIGRRLGTDAVVDRLEKAIEARHGTVVLVPVYQTWDPVRDHPRFRRLMAAAGLPARGRS